MSKLEHNQVPPRRVPCEICCKPIWPSMLASVSRGWYTRWYHEHCLNAWMDEVTANQHGLDVIANEDKTN